LVSFVPPPSRDLHARRPLVLARVLSWPLQEREAGHCSVASRLRVSTGSYQRHGEDTIHSEQTSRPPLHPRHAVNIHPAATRQSGPIRTPDGQPSGSEAAGFRPQNRPLCPIAGGLVSAYSLRTNGLLDFSDPTASGRTLGLLEIDAAWRALAGDSDHPNCTRNDRSGE
jgi:hypothetical protein